MNFDPTANGYIFFFHRKEFFLGVAFLVESLIQSDHSRSSCICMNLTCASFRFFLFFLCLALKFSLYQTLKHADHWVQTASPEKFQLPLVSCNICIGWIYRTISSVEASLFLMEPNPDLIYYFIQSTCIHSYPTLSFLLLYFCVQLTNFWLDLNHFSHFGINQLSGEIPPSLF